MQDESLTKAQLIEELRQLRAEAAALTDNQVEDKLRESQRQFSALMENLPGMAYRCLNDRDWTMEFVSNGSLELTGYPAADFVVHRTVTYGKDIIHPKDQQGVWDAVQTALDDKQPYVLTYRILTADNKEKWVREQGSGTFGTDGALQALEGFITDITEQKITEEKIRKMAYHDHLTGLPNRALFYDRLQQGLAHARRSQKLMGVLMLDLDHFKSINDELGHEWGDQALIEVGRRLLQCVRATDTVARLGGDEFSIILVDVNSEEAACKMAEKVIAAIKQPLSLKASQHTLGASIGICLASPDDVDMKSLMNKADSAMYQAKKSGKNCYHISEQQLS